MTANPALFAELLGHDYTQLPPAVRAFHDAPLPARYQGRARVEPARGLLARCFARAANLPVHGGEVPVLVTVQADGEGQRWHRQFDGRPMVSTLLSDAGLLRERLGWTTFNFRLHADASGVHWQTVSVRVLGLRLPLSWFKGVTARESERDGRYRFSVGASMPLVGHVVAYEGWLEPCAS